MGIQKWLRLHTEHLSGKTVAISGATGGLGKELCKYLASLGASLILLDRNMTKSHALREELQKEYPSLEVTHVQVDMSDLTSVKGAVETLRTLPLHYLILNAGAYSIPRYTTPEGYDNVFTINFISPYFMVKELLPHLKECDGRVVAVGSIAHNYSKIDASDIDFSTRKKASLVYGNAKRHMMYALQELLKEEGLPLAITHPGITFTGITAHYPKVIFALIKHPMKVIFMPPKKAALSILLGCFSTPAYGKWIGPALFDVWGMPKEKALRTAKKEERNTIFIRAEDIYTKVK